MGKKIGIITIGQSPRKDVVPEMTLFFGNNVEVLEAGALDGLTPDQVKTYYPENGMTHLVSRMRDGTEIIVAKEKLIPRIETAIIDLNRKSVSLILLLCVGNFPQFQSACLIVEPQKIVDHCIEGLIGASHRLGIVIPIAEQEDWVRETFSELTTSITVTVASPYAGQNDLLAAAAILNEAACDLIVMYCMGFNRQLTRPIREITAKPVIVSSAIVARTIGELLE
ncbi:MAG: AroM family protein [Deltaproteobacteria bacterium]|nr:AroM family protein [Deltaproteobacteria bacterium]